MGEALDTVRSEGGIIMASFFDVSSMVVEVGRGREAIGKCPVPTSKCGCVVAMIRGSVGICVGTTCEELLESMVLRGAND